MTKPAGYFDSLFRYSVDREIELPGGSTLKVVAHQLGAQKSGTRERLAMAEARQSFRRFNDPDDYAYLTLEEWLDTQSEEELTAAVESVVRAELIRESIRQIEYNTNNEPPIEEREPPPDSISGVLEKEIADEDKQAFTQEARRQYVENNLPTRLEVYTRKHDRLRAKAREVAVDRAVQDIHDVVFGDATLLYGIFKEDGKTPLFEELPSDAPQAIKDQLHLIYAEVDRPSYDPSS